MKEFIKALNSIAEEKKVDKSIVIEAMEQAMSAAYKKEGVQNVQTKVDPETGDIRNYSYRTVVEEVTNPELEISLEEARKLVDDIEVGEIILGNELPLKDFGRVAAGTAKQIVVQRIKEAEKQSISEEFLRIIKKKLYFDKKLLSFIDGGVLYHNAGKNGMPDSFAYPTAAVSPDSGTPVTTSASTG